MYDRQLLLLQRNFAYRVYVMKFIWSRSGNGTIVKKAIQKKYVNVLNTGLRT